MDNIAEGFEQDGTKEFIQFLSIAKGSAGELQSQLYRSLDRKHADQNRFTYFNREVLIISNQIGGVIKYLKKTELQGKKSSRSFQTRTRRFRNIEPEPRNLKTQNTHGRSSR